MMVRFILLAIVSVKLISADYKATVDKSAMPRSMAQEALSTAEEAFNLHRENHFAVAKHIQNHFHRRFSRGGSWHCFMGQPGSFVAAFAYARDRRISFTVKSEDRSFHILLFQQ